jgi:hypothetical protein
MDNSIRICLETLLYDFKICLHCLLHLYLEVDVQLEVVVMVMIMCLQ